MQVQTVEKANQKTDFAALHSTWQESAKLLDSGIKL